ncbi:MAG: hypothetical protein QW247_06035 [Pyrobaculum sp.]
MQRSDNLAVGMSSIPRRGVALSKVAFVNSAFVALKALKVAERAASGVFDRRVV